MRSYLRALLACVALIAVSVSPNSAPLAQSYRSWFLEYASYVILDRAVPHMDDDHIARVFEIGRAHV